MKTVHNTGIITSYLSDTQTRTRSHAHPLLSGSPVPALCRHLTNGGTFLGCNIDEICNHAMLWVCSIHVPIICVYSRFWFYMHILVFCFVFLLIAHTPNIHIDYIVKLRRHGYIAHMSCMCLSCFLISVLGCWRAKITSTPHGGAFAIMNTFFSVSLPSENWHIAAGQEPWFQVFA